ncbi:DUF6538 domain-containing protein [Roseovarius aestuariivivens]|uniref:DUF6538 domain-containing protein n=1 Tax=Roseovarius aestuariivivens TaxID=1888910 RepID=UPI001080F14E|nr:DUF6538 domain-containing protein [Roseovarius aestuariivivens]
MAQVTSYIRKSKTGFYSYRRRVPDDCRDVFGKREEKRSLKTKSHSEALAKGAFVNAKFEKRVAEIRRGNDPQASDVKVPSVLDVHYARQSAEEFLTRYGIHPLQKPDFQASPEEVRAYADTVAEFFNRYADLKDEGTDPATGETIYTKRSPADQWDQAALILRGEQPSTVEPTLEECVKLYLEINQEKKQRSEHNKKKFEQANWRAALRLATFLEYNLSSDLQTPLKNLSKPLMRQYREYLRREKPSWSNATLNKEIQRLQAIFNCGCDHFDLPLKNPFSGLQLETNLRERQAARRSFTPQELNEYLKHARASHEQVKLVALLMSHAGCRTMEAAGLTVGEIKLDANTPHIQLRHNRIRQLKNDASERDLPLVGEALEELRNYVAKHDQREDPQAPLLPRYGRDGGMDSISQTLNRIIRKKMEIKDSALVAYSARHTMKDKLRAVRTPEHIQHAIMGHASQNSIAGGYGSGERLTEMQEQLALAYECEDWGNF